MDNFWSGVFACGLCFIIFILSLIGTSETIYTNIKSGTVKVGKELYICKPFTGK